MEKREEPVIFVTPGKSKDTLKQSTTFLKSHQGQSNQIMEVVCDISPAFLSGIAEQLPNAEVAVDLFHVMQIFTRALDDVRKSESHVTPLPKILCWAVLKCGMRIE